MLKAPEFDMSATRMRNPVSAIRLSTTDVHVWSVQLDSLFDPDALSEVLITAEIASLNDSVASIEQQRQVIAQGLLRFVLSLYLEVSPAAVTIEFENDKARLSDNFDQSLRFNASVAEAEAMFAVTRNRNVGIDLVYQQEVDQSMLVSAKHLTPGEQNLLAQMPEVNRSNAFYRLQSRRSALAKARQSAMAMAAAVGGGSTPWAPLGHLSFGRASVDGWTAEDINAPAGYASALVAERNDWRMQEIRLVADK